MENENTALEKTGKPSRDLIAMLDKMAPKLQEAAAEGMDAKRLIRVFGGLATRNPGIYECTPESVVNCMVLCAQTGLEPGGYPPLVDLIPRRNGKRGGIMELNWQVGYRGLIHLGQRSGEVVRVAASAVFDWEIASGLFSYQIEPPVLLHRASLDMEPGPTEARNVVGAYAVAEFPGGHRAQAFLNRSQIEQRKRCAPDQTVWNANYPAMARKSAIRALYSGGTVPMQRELRTALEVEHEEEVQVVDMGQVPTVDAPRLATSRSMFSPPAPVIEAQIEQPNPPPEPEPPKRPGRPVGSRTKPKAEPAPDPQAAPSAEPPSPYERARAVALSLDMPLQELEQAAMDCGCPPMVDAWTDQDCAMVTGRMKIAKGVR